MRCPHCKRIRLETDFTKCRTRRSGRACYCKWCCRVEYKEWRLNNIERARELSRKSANRFYKKHRAEILKKQALRFRANPQILFERGLKRYDLTMPQYRVLLTEQSGVCAVCKRRCPTGRRLAVDHNHKNGKVRGLLCCNCNVAIGKLNDSPALLRKAAEYLEKFHSKTSTKTNQTE